MAHVANGTKRRVGGTTRLRRPASRRPEMPPLSSASLVRDAQSIIAYPKYIWLNRIYWRNGFRCSRRLIDIPRAIPLRINERNSTTKTETFDIILIVPFQIPQTVHLKKNFFLREKVVKRGMNLCTIYVRYFFLATHDSDMILRELID